MKHGFNKVQENISRERAANIKIFTTANIKFSQHNPQNNLSNFLTLQKHFDNLKIFREHLWNNFETDTRGMFLEYSGIITLWLLEFAKRSTVVIIKSDILNTKTAFPSRTC